MRRVSLYTGFLIMSVWFSSCKKYQKVYYQDGSLELKTEVKDGILHGKTIGYYKNGNVKLEGLYNQGKLQGPLIRYYENGAVESKENYVDDKLSGIITWFDSTGSVTDEVEFTNGVEDGKSISFFPSGQIKTEFHYANGVLHGPYTAFHKNGKLNMTAIMENGTAVYYQEFDSAGFKMEEHWQVIVEGPEVIEFGDTYQCSIRLPGPKDGLKSTIKYYNVNVADAGTELIVAGEPVFGHGGIITGSKLQVLQGATDVIIEGSEIISDEEKNGLFRITPSEGGPHLFKGIYFLEGKTGPNKDKPLMKSYKFEISFTVESKQS